MERKLAGTAPNAQAAKLGKTFMDRRTVRTRRWLREALIDLMKEKPYEAITVHEITDRADTARVTFYRNFTDKDALLHSCLDEFRKELEPVLQSPV